VNSFDSKINPNDANTTINIEIEGNVHVDDHSNAIGPLDRMDAISI
jgi:hypothetical protein